VTPDWLERPYSCHPQSRVVNWTGSVQRQLSRFVCLWLFVGEGAALFGSVFGVREDFKRHSHV
jgi:hypothetical protein